MAKAKTTKKSSTSKTTAKKTTKKSTTKASTKTKPKSKDTKSKEVPVDRRVAKQERRGGDERRKESIPVDVERRSNPERREKVSRRRQIDPTTCERDYNNDEIEFMHALDAYKRAAGRMFPTCSEILEVIRDLGYRRLTPEELAKLRPEEAALEVENEDGEASESGSEEDATNAGFGLPQQDFVLEDSFEDFDG